MDEPTVKPAIVAGSKIGPPVNRTLKIAQFVLGIGIGFGGFLLLDPKSRFLAPPNTLAPPGSLRLVALVLILGLLHLASGVWRHRQLQKADRLSASDRPKLRRQSAKAGWSLLRHELILSAILLFTVGSHWNRESIGLNSEWPIAVAFAAGFAAYVAFLAVLSLVLKITGRLPAVEDNNLRVLAYIWPRAPRQKIGAFIGLCLLNPFVEEMLFRGVLVHQLAYAADALPLALALGLTLNLGNHAYQGPLAVTTHLPFYLIAVGLLYSPTGLWGSIGFHFAGDLMPVMTLNHSLRRYIARHRRAKR